MFGTPDRNEAKNIDFRNQVHLPAGRKNVPVSLESKLIGSPNTQKRNDVGGHEPE